MGAASSLQADKYMALSKQAVTFSGGAQPWAVEPRKKHLNVTSVLLSTLFQAQTQQS